MKNSADLCRSGGGGGRSVITGTKKSGKLRAFFLSEISEKLRMTMRMRMIVNSLKI